MKKYFKRGIALFVAVIISISLCGCAESDDFPKPTKKFFVNDFANVMTEADEELVYGQAVALQEKTKAQAVVVTIDSLNGQDAYEYALELGREWGVGDKDEDNGVVVLFSKKDREIYVAVGYGLEGALPDSKTGRIIDTYGVPYFSSEEFSKGIVEIYNSIVNEIYIEYDIEVPENYTPVGTLPESDKQTQYGEQATAGEVGISWLVLVIIIVLYITIFGGRGGLFIFGGPRFFVGPRFHGGFGGSSGGFGGFKGGGGSFGGGGAGRKF